MPKAMLAAPASAERNLGVTTCDIQLRTCGLRELRDRRVEDTSQYGQAACLLL
jgi:hypothetical protein